MDEHVLVEQILNKSYKVDGGLTQEAFLFSSTITPLINVDLLTKNKGCQILLSWRDDEYCGTGWHIPGGIIRHGEKIQDRIQKTAISEFGCEVKNVKFVKITEQLLNQEERNHFISLLYECELEDDFDLERVNAGIDGKTSGYLRWFDSNPGLVYSQYGYFEFIDNYFKENFCNEH